MSHSPKIRDMMKNSTIYGHCEPCWVNWVLDASKLLAEYGHREWGPTTTIKDACPSCGRLNTGAFVSYSGLPHGQTSDRTLGQ